MRSKSIRLPLAAAALSLAMLTSCGAPGGAGSSVSSASSSGSGAQSAPAAVQVEPLTVQDFPCSTTEEFTALFQKMVQETPDQIYYHPYTGLFQEAVEADGLSQGRKLYTYIPEETGHCASSVFVALPSGEKAEEFLVSSGWTAVADQYKFLLHALTPADSQWGGEEELDYLSAAFALEQDDPLQPIHRKLLLCGLRRRRPPAGAVGHGQSGQLLRAGSAGRRSHRRGLSDPDGPDPRRGPGKDRE